MQQVTDTVSSDNFAGAAASASAAVATTNSETTQTCYPTVTAAGIATTTATIVQPPSTLSSQAAPLTLPPIATALSAMDILSHVAPTPAAVDMVATSSASPPPPLPALQALGERRRVRPAGILRLDMNKPRRSSGGSVEFRAQPQMLGEDITSPTGGVTSPHQLSVTWATPPYDTNEHDWRQRSESADASILSGRLRRYSSQEEKPYEFSCHSASPVDGFDSSPQGQLCEAYSAAASANDNNNNTNNNQQSDDELDDDEDYSVSVTAIIQRRASVRGYRGKRGSRYSRRASSPMDHLMDTVERRRSSVYTSSSDEGTNQESTQEQIFENIRLHKEVIQSVKLQPWPMRKKLKLVRQAKTYVARHEGALQERFAMSRSTKDLWARFKILMAARWLHWKRETVSFLTVLIPWELRIKEIESHFGSGVASHFTFLRWLMWVNTMIAIPLVAFVIGPEYFATKKDETDPRKRMTEHEYKVAGNFFTFWEFEGYIKYSPMFYGYYSNISGASTLGYKLPMAYFLTAVVVYIYSFVATLRKMAENSRNSKLSLKDDECTFTWKLFTGWDFMIGHAETAHNRIASVVVGFKEVLLEEAEKKKDNRNWRIILQRILVNLVVMGLLAASAYTVVELVNHSEQLARNGNLLSRNAVNITITLLAFFMPMIFDALGLFENWHPRQQLRLQLARIMILNMLNLYSLMFSFIYNIDSKEGPLQTLKERYDNSTYAMNNLTIVMDGYKSNNTNSTAIAIALAHLNLSTTNLVTTTTAATTTLYGLVTRLRCRNITMKCSKPTRINNRNFTTATTLLLLNLSTSTLLPHITTNTESDTTNVWTTLPTTMPPVTTDIDTKTLTPQQQEEWSTAQFNAITAAATTITAAFSTPATDASSTTITDYTESSTTQTETTDASTLPQSTSTTTTAPGSDSFFDYMDYFVGMPLELSDSQEVASATETTLSGTSGTTENVRRARNGKNLRALQRKPRQALLSALYEATQRAPPGRYSRQLNERRRQSDRDNEAYTDSSAATTTAYTVEESTPGAQQQQLQVESASPAPQNESLPTLHVNTKLLGEVLAYFTSSTSTVEPTTTKLPPTTTTVVTTTTTTTTSTPPTTTTESDGSTTAFFLAEDDIIDESATVNYDTNEFDEDNFETCVRTICDTYPEEEVTITDLDATATPTTPSLTPMEIFEKKMFEVKLDIQQVQRNLTSMCWETSLGQELAKVIVSDGLLSLFAPLCVDFLRALFVRYLNKHWCWDMEKTFPQYGDFKIAENILNLIINQGQVWMGIFFSPGLVLVSLVKLMILMYFRSWIVLTCNVPHEVVFKASKSNNFYLALLLTMLFLCVLPVSYAIVWLRPSWHCGPFSTYNRISDFVTSATQEALPKQLHRPLGYLTSASTVIPLLLLLILIIYYLVSLTGALREANQDLRTQLQKEREEERKKIFKVPETKPTENSAAALTSRWRKVLEASSPVTPTPPPDFESEEYKTKARKELISRIMKEALRKGSATSDDDSVNRQGRDDDDTDTEHHDSLPHDEDGRDKNLGLSKLQQIRRTRKPSLVDIVQIAKSEREREQRASLSVKERSKSEKHTRRDKERDRSKEREAKEAEKVDAEKKENEIESRKEKEKNKDDIKREEESKELEKVDDSTKERVNGNRKSKTNKKDKNKSEPDEKHQSEDEEYCKSETLPKTKKSHTTNGRASKQDIDTDNDPDTNTRIVNERRQSLLRKKREDDQPATRPTTPLPEKTENQTTKAATTPPQREEEKKSNFVIIDEKTPTSSEKEQPPAKHRSFSVRGGTFKFRRPKPKPIETAAEAEVFKFDEKSLENTNNGKLGKVSEPPRSASPPATQRTNDGLITPTFVNPEKLLNLSRQGRKKIGTLFALVRDTVNTKWNDDEQSPSSSGGPTTPKFPVTPETAKNINDEAIAIEIPSTPEAEIAAKQHFPTTIPEITIEPKVAAPCYPTTASDINLSDSEALDKPGPIYQPPLQRRKPIERAQATRQDSQTSVWSDNIPTITISTTGSDECIPKVDPEKKFTTPIIPVAAVAPLKESVVMTVTKSAPPSPDPKVKVIKIDIEDK
ncbi:transmembrane channel-like protein [Bactrocera neohumeralis]|uniref:transmembrane channel-like protein n=1 Tax=Bactrocera neohumeralis TaxID=98809 RepID=UPI002165416A|nr:transmembrane channel-like protein [Bactrocera neohumeralis]